MNEIIVVIEEAPEGGFTAKALAASIFTEGDDLDSLKENIKDAIKCHFDDPDDQPKVIRLHWVKEEVMAL